MNLSIKKLLRVFVFTLTTCTFLYIFYGLTLSYSIDILKYSNVLKYALFFVFIIAFVLSIFFNKSRVFLILLLLLLLYISTSSFFLNFLDVSFFLPAVNIFIFKILIILFNIIIISLYREKGIFTSWGLRRTFFIIIQVYIYYYIIRKNVLSEKIMKYFNENFLELGVLNNLPNILLILLFLSLSVLLIRLKHNEDYAFLSILIHIFVLFFYLENYQEFFLIMFKFLSVLFLVIGIIRDSYSMAYLDQLTGLPGRRALEEEILKLGSTYSIGMLDIDFFKKFNDKYGHDIGDEVLKMVASRMKKTKGGAKVFRYGGEEFTIVFSNKGVEKAYHNLDELRKDIANNPFIIRNKNRTKDTFKKRKGYKKRKKYKKIKTLVGGEKVKITVSIGVAEKLDKHKNANEVIKDADKALYKAKKKGRNCVLS